MDATRALLDALMGPDRNAKADAKQDKGTGPEFTGDNICKNFLCGFCPHDWFQQKGRQLKHCNKIHSELLREKFETHDEKEYFRVEYEEDFLVYLEKAAQDCDAYISRERPKCRKKEEIGKIVRLPPDVKDKVDDMEKQYADFIMKSEGLADESLTKSQDFMQKAIALKEDIDGIKQKYTQDFAGEDLCEICGVKYPLGGGSLDWHDKESHYRGKTHMGFAQIRDKIKELKGKRKNWDKMKEKYEKDSGNRWRDRNAERERERDRDREKQRKEQRARDREQEREREREKEKEREAGKQREKEREERRLREKKMEKERDIEKEKEREKEKEKEREKAKRGRSRSSSSSSRGKDKKKDKTKKEKDNKGKEKEKDKDKESKAKKAKVEKKPTSSSSDDEDDLAEILEKDIPFLWVKMGKMTAEEREKQVRKLSDKTHDRLEQWLMKKMAVATAKKTPTAMEQRLQA